MLTFAFYFIIALSSCIARSDYNSLWARIDRNGIRFQIIFSQVNSTTIFMSVPERSGVDFDMNVEVYEHPTMYEKNCIDTGKKIYRFPSKPKNLLTGYFMVAEDNGINVKSMRGRSLVISDSTGKKLACAAILSAGRDIKYATATFSSKSIVGKIELIQKGVGQTVITGKIHHLVDITVLPKYPIYNNKGNIKAAEIRRTVDKKNILLSTISNVDNKIVQLEGAYTVHRTPYTTYSKFTRYGMYIYTGNTSNLRGKCPDTIDLDSRINSYQIRIGIKANTRFTTTKSDLMLVGESSVLGKLLVITLQDKLQRRNKFVIGCEIIKLEGPVTAKAEFKANSSNDISGYISFRQNTPYDITRLETNLQRLAKRAGAYHVHEFPISDQVNRCSKESVGGIWNPYYVDAPPSGRRRGTLDQYPCGDLSGKFGNLNNQDLYQNYFSDSNLQLFGERKLIGRSIVIHRTNEREKGFACANIV